MVKKKIETLKKNSNFKGFFLIEIKASSKSALYQSQEYYFWPEAV